MPNLEKAEEIFTLFKMNSDKYQSLPFDVKLGIALRRSIIRGVPRHLEIIHDISLNHSPEIKTDIFYLRSKTGLTALDLAIEYKKWSHAQYLFEEMECYLLINPKGKTIIDTLVDNLKLHDEQLHNIPGRDVLICLLKSIREANILTTFVSDFKASTYDKDYNFLGEIHSHMQLPIAATTEGSLLKSILDASDSFYNQDTIDNHIETLRLKLHLLWLNAFENKVVDYQEKTTQIILSKFKGRLPFCNIIYNYLTGEDAPLYLHTATYKLNKYLVSSYIDNLTKESINGMSNAYSLRVLFQQDSNELNACGMHALFTIVSYANYFLGRVKSARTESNVVNKKAYHAFTAGLNSLLKRYDAEREDNELDHHARQVLFKSLSNNETSDELKSNPLLPLRHLAAAHPFAIPDCTIIDISLSTKEVYKADNVINLLSFAHLFRLSQMLWQQHEVIMHPILVGVRRDGVMDASLGVEGHYVALCLCVTGRKMSWLAANSWKPHDKKYLPQVIDTINTMIQSIDGNTLKQTIIKYKEFERSVFARQARDIRQSLKYSNALSLYAVQRYASVLETVHEYFQCCGWHTVQSGDVKIEKEIHNIVADFLSIVRTFLDWGYLNHFLDIKSRVASILECYSTDNYKPGQLDHKCSSSMKPH